MTEQHFRALVLDKGEGGTTQTKLQELTTTDLPEGEVTVAISHSGVNYKDALAVTGRGRIARSLPMVPGIDFAGTVIESDSPRFAPGDRVLLTGWGVGEGHWGGFSEFARVKADWLMPLPGGLEPDTAMALGTSGLTAMLCLLRLERHGLRQDGGEIVVSGASGGVGRVAVAALADAGYQVVAVSGSPDPTPLLALGASEVVPRETLSGVEKPLLGERWQGGVDVAGGKSLAGMLAAVRYSGAVAACGLAETSELNTTVFPFILRGVSLLGVDSVQCPQPLRDEAWTKLASLVAAKPALVEDVSTVCLDEVPEACRRLLDGEFRGKYIIKMKG